MLNFVHLLSQGKSPPENLNGPLASLLVPGRPAQCCRVPRLALGQKHSARNWGSPHKQKTFPQARKGLLLVGAYAPIL